MTKTAYSYYQDTLKELQREGLYKEEQTIVTRQNSRIETKEAARNSGNPAGRRYQDED